MNPARNFKLESNRPLDKLVLKETFNKYLHGLSLEKEIIAFWEYLRKQNPDSFKILDVGSGDKDLFLQYLLLNEENIKKRFTSDPDLIEMGRTHFESKNVVGLDNSKKPNDNAWHVLADVAEIPLDDKSCNIVLANAVMAFFIDSNEKGYPFHTDKLEDKEYNFEEIVKELLRVTSDPGVCMFDLPSYEMCDDSIAFNKRHPEIYQQVSTEEFEKRKIFLTKAFPFLQNLRNEGYTVNFLPVTNRSVTGVTSHFAVHITKNPEEYAKLQKDCLEKDNDIALEKELYLYEYPNFSGFTYDMYHELYPGAKTLKSEL